MSISFVLDSIIIGNYKYSANHLFGAEDHVHEVHVLIGAVLAGLDDEHAKVARVGERILLLYSIDVAQGETERRRHHCVVR